MKGRNRNEWNVSARQIEKVILLHIIRQFTIGRGGDIHAGNVITRQIEKEILPHITNQFTKGSNLNERNVFTSQIEKTILPHITSLFMKGRNIISLNVTTTLAEIQKTQARGHMCPGTLKTLRIFLFVAVYFIFYVPKVPRHKINFCGTAC